MAVNTVVIEGNLVRDLELRFSAAGNAVCSGSIAYNERIKNDAGDWEDGDPTFVDFVCFKAMAEQVAESLEKGDRAVIFGRLQMDRWDDKNSGESRSKLKVVAELVSPSLRWATAEVTKVHASSSKPATSTTPAYDKDEELF